MGSLDLIGTEDQEEKLKEAQLLASLKDASPNEIWDMFGMEGVSDEERKKMQEEWRMLGV